MAVLTNSDEGRILRNFVPLASFPSEAFVDLCKNIKVEQLKDEAIFKRGDQSTDLIYLLNGSVVLQADELIVDVINSDSESAKFALAHQIPRKIDAIANGVVRIVRLTADIVNNPPQAVYDENQGFTLIEDLSEDSDDWMTALLRLPLFQNLSAINLQKILISLKTAHYSENEVIIKEESPVDSFFLIIKGQCLLARTFDDEAHQVKLSTGDSFGDEYLITDAISHETVTALNDVSVIQLNKKHFLDHIKTPLVDFIAPEDLPGALQTGAIVLDVRLPLSFVKQNLIGSANIPLMTLRMRLGEIPKDKQVIVVCAKGIESEAGAFLLTKNNIDARVLKGGMGIEEAEEDDAQESLPFEPAEDSTSFEQENVPENLPDESSSVIEVASEDLNAENERLLQVNREMQAKIIQLQTEKEQAESRNQVLTQQLERLKDILNRLTKSK
ncbi:MAG: cyclic nucleotide-binding domain-containing protein [Methylococcaceae bacterium]|nr:cyclic nucleotide-binding domain-containing protein [Methylococcaceae bacterium]